MGKFGGQTCNFQTTSAKSPAHCRAETTCLSCPEAAHIPRVLADGVRAVKLCSDKNDTVSVLSVMLQQMLTEYPF
jgi:hypothetical protein